MGEGHDAFCLTGWISATRIVVPKRDRWFLASAGVLRQAPDRYRCHTQQLRQGPAPGPNDPPRHLAAQRRSWFSACSGSGQRSSDGVKTGNRAEPLAR